MRPTTGRLDVLTLTAEARARRLRELVDGVSLPLTPANRRLLSFAMIEGANLWAQFCRSYYISSALQAKDSAGQPIVIAVQVQTAEDAIDIAIRAGKPRLASCASSPCHEACGLRCGSHVAATSLARDRQTGGLPLSPCQRES